MFCSFQQKQLKDLVLILSTGSSLFVGMSIYEGNERFYRDYIMPCVRCLDPERAHNFAIFLAKNNLVPSQKKPDPPILVSYTSS